MSVSWEHGKGGSAKTALVCTAFVLAFGIAGRLDAETAREQTRPAPVQVQEDELFWDCTTSGDFTCGEPITNLPAPGALAP